MYNVEGEVGCGIFLDRKLGCLSVGFAMLAVLARVDVGINILAKSWPPVVFSEGISGTLSTWVG